MTKASGTIDMRSLKEGHDDASTKATTYITAIDQNGIKVHAENNPNLNYTKINAEGMEVHQNVNNADTMVASFGASGAQIGQTDGAHSVLDANGQRFYATDGTTQLANIGYGEGTAESGTSTKPYYSFGVRSGTVGNYSVAEGNSVTKSQAQGGGTVSLIASGYCSHAEGGGAQSSGAFSHAENCATEARAHSSHAEGRFTIASGNFSHAQNDGTKAQGESQTALGKYNVADNTSAVIIGNGTADDARSNALTIEWNGDVNLAGQAKTSFKSSIAMGSYGSAQTTVPNLVDEVRFSSGCCGSVSIGTAYTANNVTIATGWYNFMYMPHRSGGVNGSASGDNCNYGNLFLFGMNNTNGRFIVRVSSGSIAEVAQLYTSIERYTRSNAGALDWSNQTDGDAKVIMKSALAFWNGAYNGTGSNLRYSANGEIIGTNTSPSTITVSASSTTTGTLSSSTCRQYGKVVYLTLSVKNTSAVASGSNFYSATLSTSVPAPVAQCSGSSFYAGRAIGGYIDTSRKVVIRNSSGSSVTLGSNDTVNISFTYIRA